jgi:translation initiation factor IF-3
LEADISKRNYGAPMKKDIKDQHVTNETIIPFLKTKKTDEVLLIGEDGYQYGNIPFRDALLKAEDLGLDVVLVGPNADPPVCKFMDYGKLQYDKMKKVKKNKAKNIDAKLLKMSVSIEKHDLQVKINQVKKFVSQGKKVKVKIFLKGREVAYPEIGKKLLETMYESLEEFAVLEEPITIVERTISMGLAPKI